MSILIWILKLFLRQFNCVSVDKKKCRIYCLRTNVSAKYKWRHYYYYYFSSNYYCKSNRLKLFRNRYCFLSWPYYHACSSSPTKISSTKRWLSVHKVYLTAIAVVYGLYSHLTQSGTGTFACFLQKKKHLVVIFAVISSQRLKAYQWDILWRGWSNKSRHYFGSHTHKRH